MRRIRRLDPWLPPFLLMAAIFILSSQPSLDSGLGLLDTIGRKLAHFAEYGLLALLWWRALRTRTTDARALAGAFALAAAYAVTDEYHQGFVEGRTASPLDWAIDTAGAAVVALAIRARIRVGAAG